MTEFVAARAAGDRDLMSRLWGELLTAAWPRLQSFVTLHGQRILSPSEREDALQTAAERMTRLVVWSFKGNVVEEFYGCLNTVARVSCLDEQRRAARRSEKTESLDRTTPEGLDRAAAAWREEFDRREQARRDEEHELELTTFGRGFLEFALPELSPRRRAVMEAVRAGTPREEIAEQLGIARNSVDQTFGRAMADLAKLKEQYDA